MKTTECLSSAFLSDLCNLSPCQCGSGNGLICQAGVCSYVEVSTVEIAVSFFSNRIQVSYLYK